MKTKVWIKMLGAVAVCGWLLAGCGSNPVGIDETDSVAHQQAAAPETEVIPPIIEEQRVCGTGDTIPIPQEVFVDVQDNLVVPTTGDPDRVTKVMLKNQGIYQQALRQAQIGRGYVRLSGALQRPVEECSL